jgi:hypothetical protein
MINRPFKYIHVFGYSSDTWDTVYLYTDIRPCRGHLNKCVHLNTEPIGVEHGPLLLFQKENDPRKQAIEQQPENTAHQVIPSITGWFIFI